MNRLRLMVAFGALMAAVVIKVQPAHAQYEIVGASIKKIWGPLKSAYPAPMPGITRAAFEDSVGTIRIVDMDPASKAAVIVLEMKRE